jgi:hypothetical protein
MTALVLIGMLASCLAFFGVDLDRFISETRVRWYLRRLRRRP